MDDQLDAVHAQSFTFIASFQERSKKGHNKFWHRSASLGIMGFAGCHTSFRDNGMMEVLLL